MENKTTKKWPAQGCGVGLRHSHYQTVISEKPNIDWFEAVSENFMDSGGQPLYVLEQVRARYPVALHGVSLSIGSVDPINERYLEQLKKLVEKIEPFVVSDHLCWSGVGGEQLHDLLPLPFTEEAMSHVVRRVQQVQEKLQCVILLENISTYVSYKHSIIPEWEFLREVSRRSGCGILLDLNNIYVNSKNHLFEPLEYLKALPAEKIGQFHLAGHTDMGDFLFDTHAGQIIEEVWNLYREALKLYGHVSTLIEWDEAVPEFSVLAEEAQKARIIYDQFDSRGTQSFRVESSQLTQKLEGPSLSESQEWLKSYVQPETQTENQHSFLNMQGTVRGEDRMAVYADGYLARIEEGLLDIFEAVAHLVGKKTFRSLAGEYAKIHPSQEYNLSLVGRRFPSFLRTASISEKFSFLPDLAKLEWFVSRAFHAFARKSLKPERMQEIAPQDWENLIFNFQPYVFVLASEYPILDLWKARKTPVSGIKIQLENRDQRVMIYRDGFNVVCKSIDMNEQFILELLLAGQSLGEAFSNVQEISKIPAESVTLWFSEWIKQGLLTDFKISSAVKS